MARGELTVDLDAVRANWQALDHRSPAPVETGAVLKANAYGLGLAPVARALLADGVRSFFVAIAEEGRDLRRALGNHCAIFVLSGHMEGDAELLARYRLTPMLNAPSQLGRHQALMPDRPFGLQLDTGMNRLGLSPSDFARLGDRATQAQLVISHLACADDATHPMNRRQLTLFKQLTDHLECRRSLAATGGLLLGADYHFDLVRPGIGLFGGQPFADARPVVRLDLPVIQTRDLAPGESVGYGATFSATAPTRIATVSAGYADGIVRRLGNRGVLFADGTSCRLAGRVSMDLLTVDVTHLAEVPDRLELLGMHQTIDQLAVPAETIGYEILTGLGARYAVHYGPLDQPRPHRSLHPRCDAPVAGHA